MNFSNKKILFLDLAQKKFESRSYPDLKKYIGGLALGLKLYEQNPAEDPIIFAIGPLNGFFPYASKTACIFKKDSEANILDEYLGGYFGSRICLAGYDAIFIANSSKEEIVIDIIDDKVEFKNADINSKLLGLPGKRSSLFIENEKLVSDQYYEFNTGTLQEKFLQKNLKGVSITGSRTFKVKDMDKYYEIFTALLKRSEELTVDRGFFPSCAMCPMGCEKSKLGESGGNVILKCLVACGSTEKIYNDVGTIFSCLNVLGYDYTHEDIENLPSLIQNTLMDIKL